MTSGGYVTYAELRDRVAQGGELPPSRLGDLDGIDLSPAKIRGFLEPKLAQEGSSDHAGGRPTVILLRAPAAVGKTTLAEALASDTSNPLWNLARFTMGDYFFTGTLSRQFGGQGMAAFETLLKQGEVTLVLDAVDEAIARSGFPGFEAALRDLCSVLSGGSAHTVPAVLLGRPENLDQAAVVLEELGMAWEVLNVAYFERDEARDFVDLKLDKTDGRNVASALEFFDEFYDSVAQALAQGDAPDGGLDFLGYAPVLDAIAAFCNSQDNPHAVFQGLKTDSSKTWELLASIVESTMVRESEKVGAAFAAGEPDLEPVGVASYSPRAQTYLLTSVPGSVDLSLEDASELSDEYVARFDGAWRALYEDHPFRKRGPLAMQNPFMGFSSVVFRDFVAAFGVLNFDELDRLILLDQYAATIVQPSPLFAKFFMALAGTSPAGCFGGELLPCLIDSISTDIGISPIEGVVEDYVSLDQGEGPELVEIRLRSASSSCDVKFEFDLPVLRLGRSLAHTQIDLDGFEVVIPGGLRDFSLGPSCSIRSRKITFDVDSVRVLGGDSEVSLKAEEFQASTTQLRAADPRRFIVDAPRLGHPWKAFAMSAGDDRRDEVRLREASRELRKLAKWYAKSSAAGKFTYPANAMERILARRRASPELFEFLAERKMIVRDGNSFRLDLPFALTEALAANYQDSAVAELLTEYLAESGAGA